MEIEIKQEKLKIPKTLDNTINSIIIAEEYLYHILRHKKYRA